MYPTRSRREISYRLKDEFKNPTLQNDHKERDAAELPVCTCPASPREHEEAGRMGRRKGKASPPGLTGDSVNTNDRRTD